MPALLESGGDLLRIYTEWAGGGHERVSPLLVPAGPDDLARHYDLTISHSAVHADQFMVFERWLAWSAARRGLSCAVLHDGVVREAIHRIEQGRLRVCFHLDYFALWHVPDDPYARLAEAVHRTGGRTVNVPERSRRFTDKAAAHVELSRHGLGVPDTVLLPPGMPARALTPAERASLRLDEPGARVYVKPANGFGGKGVVRVDRPDSESLKAAFAAARREESRDTFLVQRAVRCPELACDDAVERPAYWRVLYCLGDVIPFWWSKWEPGAPRPSYRRLTESESERHGLRPVLAFTQALADLCGLAWFSTELCLSDGTEPSRYRVKGTARDGAPRQWPVLAIDYVNDQCDVDVQSRWPGAPPDDVVRHVAERFAATAAAQARLSRRAAAA